jgi:hypothetical protein
MVGDFNTPLSAKYRFQTKNQKQIMELNDTIDKMDLTDVYRMYQPSTAQYTFFSAAHGPFSKTDHILGDKASFSKYTKRENPLLFYMIICKKSRTQQQKQ